MITKIVMRASNRECVLRHAGLKLCRRVCDVLVNTEKPRAQGDHAFTASDHKTPKLLGFLQDFWEFRGRYGSLVVTLRSSGDGSGADAGIPVGTRMRGCNPYLGEQLSAPRVPRNPRPQMPAPTLRAVRIHAGESTRASQQRRRMRHS